VPIEDVQDSETLEAYLDALPDGDRKQISVGIAYRAALRVFPIAAEAFLTTDWARKGNLTPVAFFGALSISGVAAVSPTPDIARAAGAAALAAANTANAADFEVDVWELIRSDLSAHKVLETPLWGNGEAPAEILKCWNNAKAAMDADTAVDWSIWIAWFERAIKGPNWHPEEMAKVLVTINQEDWEQRPALINHKFDKLLARYKAENFIAANPYGLRAIIDKSEERIDLEETQAIDMSDVIDQIVEAIEDFERRSKQAAVKNNLAESCATVLRGDLAELKEKAQLLGTDPQKLHRQLGRYIDRFKGILIENDLPQTKDTSSLFKDLHYAQDDICVVSEVVRNAEERRAAVRITKELDTYLLTAIHNGLNLAADGEGQMRVYAILAVQSLLDENVSKDEKIAWIQFANRMALESSLLITQHVEEKGEEKSRFGRAVENIKEVKDGAIALDKIGDVAEEAVTELVPLGQRLLEGLCASNFSGLL